MTAIAAFLLGHFLGDPIIKAIKEWYEILKRKVG